jgi:hypothetical protein
MFTTICIGNKYKTIGFRNKSQFFVLSRSGIDRVTVADWINHNFSVGLWPLKNDYEAYSDG